MRYHQSNKGEGHREKQRCQETETPWPRETASEREGGPYRAPAASDAFPIPVPVYAGSLQFNLLVLTVKHFAVKGKKEHQGKWFVSWEISVFLVLS